MNNVNLEKFPVHSNYNVALQTVEWQGYVLTGLQQCLWESISSVNPRKKIVLYYLEF